MPYTDKPAPTNLAVASEATCPWRQDLNRGALEVSHGSTLHALHGKNAHVDSSKLCDCTRPETHAAQFELSLHGRVNLILQCCSRSVYCSAYAFQSSCDHRMQVDAVEGITYTNGSQQGVESSTGACTIAGLSRTRGHRAKPLSSAADGTRDLPTSRCSIISFWPPRSQCKLCEVCSLARTQRGSCQSSLRNSACHFGGT